MTKEYLTLEEAYHWARLKSRPVFFKGDLICNICGEPWDYYGVQHGDMTAEEKRDFILGVGCPSCKGIS